MKKCTNCNESKKLTEFHNSSKYKDGVQLWCKSCANIHGAYRMRKKFAIQDNIPFKLTFKEYYEIRKNTLFCPITKEPFRAQGLGNGIDSATLDKINPSLGYIKSNVAFISRKANSIKNSIASSTEAKIIFNEIIKYMESHGI